MRFLLLTLIVSFSLHSWAFAEGRTVKGIFTTLAGARAYQLYIPSKATEKMPLFVVLHGCFQSGDDMVRGTYMNELAEQKQFYVLYPEQGYSNHPWKCWNWFMPENQQRESGEASIIAGITRWVLQEYPVDSNKIFVSGLSAGGGLASNLMGCYSDLFTGVMVHSGMEYAAAKSGEEALEATKHGATADLDLSARAAYACSPRRTKPIPALIIHGTSDSYVNPLNGDRILTQFLKLNQLIHPSAQLSETHSRIVRENQLPATLTDISLNGALTLRKISVEDLGHAWSGGRAPVRYMDPRGVDASGLMVDFFLNQSW